jgi:hypothetical protein
MKRENVDVGLDTEEFWIIHFDKTIRYFADDEDDANWALKSFLENSYLPFVKTRLDKFAQWCIDFESHQTP